ATIANSIPELIYWGLLEINTNAKHALENLAANANRPALDALRAFFSTVNPYDYKYNIVSNQIRRALEAIGIPNEIATLMVDHNVIDLVADDEGLYVAVKAAHSRLKA